MLAPPKPPSHDDPEALIKEARARQLRRRLLVAAGLAVVAGIGLTVHALTVGDSGETSVRSGLPRGTAPLCRSSQLSVSAIWDGASGNLFNFFTITNKGAAPCSLPTGSPTVLLTRGGSQLKVDERHSDNQFPGKPVSSLAPGRRAIVHLDWWNWCGPRLTYAETTTTVTVQFAGGLRVTAPHLVGQPPCITPGHPSVITVGSPMKPRTGEL
jgi:hypothetical protein